MTTYKHFCNFCKIEELTASSDANCYLCKGEITARTKLLRVRKNIKYFIKELNIDDENDLINTLKEDDMLKIINNLSSGFHGDNDDIKLIIDNYFDKKILLPLIRVNYHKPVNLNVSRKFKKS
jgi:hypothetical protein